MRKQLIRLAIAIKLSLLCTGPAAATDVFDPVTDIYDLLAQGFEDAWPDDFIREGWQVDVGAGTAVLPKYVGSNSYRLAAIPLVRVSYDNFLSLRNTKLRVDLLHYGRFRAGAVAKYAFGRTEDGNPVLAGLGNIGDTMELGGFVRFTHNHFGAKLEFRESVSAGQGGTLYLNARQGVYSSERTRIGVLGSFILASGEKTRTNFGITEAQAARSAIGLDPFDASGGPYQANLFLGGEYALSPHWRLGGMLGYTRLLGDAANSPIVAAEGSANQLSAGVGILHRF